MKRFYLFSLLILVSFSTLAQSTLVEWQQKLRTAKHDTTKLSCYGGILEIPLHDDSVVVYLKKAEIIGKKYPNHPTNINIFIRYGNMHRARAKNITDSVKYFYDRAFILALQINNKRYIKFADFYRTYSIQSLANKINHLYQVLNKYNYDYNNVFDRSLQYQIYNYLIHNYLTFGNITKAKNLLSIAKPYMITLQDSVKYYNAFTRIIALDAESIYKSGKAQPNLTLSNTFNIIYHDLMSFTERNNLPYLRVEPLSSYGKILFYEKQYNEATKIAQELLTHAQKYKYPHAMNLGNMLFAESYFELGQYQKALVFLEKTIPNNIIQNYKRLALFSKIYQAMGDYPKAYKYLLEATKEEEQVKGVNEQVLSAEIESQMELNKKQQELAAKELENRLKEERLKIEKQERIALELRSKLALYTKEKEIYFQKNEIATQKTNNVIKEQRIKIEERQKYIFMSLVALALGLLGWAVWNYRKQKQLSERLERKRHKLETQAQELTEANQTKDKIFAVLGHDLRSPLNDLKVIMMLFHSKDITPAKMKSMVQELTTKMNSVQEMMNNLLQWSLLELKHQPIQLKSISIKKIIEKAIGQLSSFAEKKEIVLETNLKEANVMCNAEEVEIIVRNLLSNAIKFTSKGGKISIDTFTQNDNVAIQIKDSGVGIPEELMHETSHYPVSKTGTEGEKGVGLGLKISRELVKRNQGMMTIKSTINRGTEVMLCFEK